MEEKTDLTNVVHEFPACQVGIVSDTHGLLRRETLTALDGCAVIIHAGDVGSAHILDQLERIAPVVAVKGNIDRSDTGVGLPPSAVVRVGDEHIYVLHDLNELDLDPAMAGFSLVISGHSHKPAWREKSGVYYLNPGSAGPRRFKLPITVATVDFTSRELAARFINLEDSKVNRSQSSVPRGPL